MQVFRETQQFRQLWIWTGIAPLVLGVIYVIYQQPILGIPVGDKPLPNVGVVLISLFVLLLVAFLLILKLTTKIDKEGVSMHYWPVIKNHKWNDINSVEIINYGFVGYGFRLSHKHGWIYNVRGNKGLKIHLKTGKHFTIGTQKSNELKDFLSSIDVDYSSIKE